MGCNASKQVLMVNSNRLPLDDSIHVMIVRDQKKLGNDNGKHNNFCQYKPRNLHPHIDWSEHTAITIEERQPAAALSKAESQNNTYRLLFHSANHNDTVDPLDIADFLSPSPSTFRIPAAA
mmetsp:Transcript_13748/g.17941  ORF Transcript_13748/g.17941 Transcript_13748/m.17941 type:complete len:121 (-) Transcript_13748:156-518(-)